MTGGHGPIATVSWANKLTYCRQRKELLAFDKPPYHDLALISFLSSSSFNCWISCLRFSYSLSFAARNFFVITIFSLLSLMASEDIHSPFCFAIGENYPLWSNRVLRASWADNGSYPDSSRPLGSIVVDSSICLAQQPQVRIVPHLNELIFP